MSEVELIYLLRIVISIVIGFFIGYERKIRMKEAGMRTHALVCAGSCIMMIISKYAFDGVDFDGSRVASQVVSGIGFIGAGMILCNKHVIHNLTTAAGIWATAGIGLAIGAGMYIFGVGTAVIIILIQILLHLPLKIYKTRRYYEYVIVLKSGEENIDTINKVFEVADVLLCTNSRNSNGMETSMKVKTLKNFTPSDTFRIINKYDFIKSIEILNDE